VVRGEVDLSDNITAYAAIGARNNQFKGLLGSTAIVTDTNGNALLPVAGISQYDKNISGEAGIRAAFDTGQLNHKLAFSISALDNETGTGRSAINYYSTNIYSPAVLARPNLTPPAAVKTGTLGLSSVAIADTISALDERLQLIVGARWQRVRASNFDSATGEKIDSYDEDALTPSVGLVVKPWDNVSLYGNIIQGLQQGLIVDSTYSNVGQIFPPYKSTQYEAGVKVDWGQFTTTLSIFQISQPSTIVDIASNTLNLSGEQRNRGIELNTFGEVADGIRVLGGVMFMDPDLTKTQDGLNDGWTAPFSPKVQVNLGGEWDTPFIQGLTLNGRLVYTGSQYIDTTEPRRQLPDWTRVDLGARYTFQDSHSPTGKPITIHFDVENVYNKDYIASGFAATAMTLGAPRTFRLSTSFQF
jgi:iron complex outermembrane receptor protein